MWSLLALLGLIVMAIGLVGLMHPIARLYVPTRGRAVLAACLGLVLLSVGATRVQPTAESQRVSAREQVVAGVLATYPGRFDLTIEGRRVAVDFSVGYNLEEETRWTTTVGDALREAAQLDVRNILEGVGASGFDYEYITVRGWFPMLDECGEAEEIVVVDAGYDRGTMDRIDWSALPPDGIYAKADQADLHRQFRAR